MTKFTLTKEEFIKRSMNGEVFIHDLYNNKYFYDDKYTNPFRFNKEALNIHWDDLNGKDLFIVENPKPIKERRWKWQKDKKDISYISEYITDKFAKDVNMLKDGWHKRENDYIDVEINYDKTSINS